MPRQFAKKIEQIFLPRDKFTSRHRHFAEHVIDCDASQFGAACGKVFLGCAGEKRLRSRARRAAETHGVERALQSGSKVVVRYRDDFSLLDKIKQVFPKIVGPNQAHPQFVAGRQSA